MIAQYMSMSLRVWHQLALSSLIALSCATGAWSHAEILSNYSLDQAKQHAQKDSKFLLVDFTASWCPPCQKMESTTWADSAVQAWIKENAIAVQIDVDKDSKSTSALKVEAVPTLVLFSPQSGSNEFGRQVGRV
jgi:thiol:disulfide interchange protein